MLNVYLILLSPEPLRHSSGQASPSGGGANSQRFERFSDSLITAAKYTHLSKDEIQAIDQYVYRFSRLQDTMGEKLFRVILSRFEENTDKLPFLDVIKKMEKYVAIDIANERLDLRKISSQLARDYEDDAIEIANILNLIYAKKDVIEGIYLTLKASCNETPQSL